MNIVNDGNLLKSFSLQQYTEFHRWIKFNSALIILSVLIASCISGWQLWRFIILTKSDDQRCHKIELYKTLNQAIEQEKQKIEALNKKLLEVQTIKNKADSVYTMLKMICQYLPADVKLTHYEYDTRGITCQAESKTLQSLMTMVDNLKQIPVLSDVQLMSIKPYNQLFRCSICAHCK